MKKMLVMTIMSLCAICFVTGCDNILNNKENYSIYEMHLYDDTFDHTEELIIKYKEDESLKYMEYYMTYDTEKACDYLINRYKESEDLKYPEVKFDCETIDGKTTIRWSMTDKSIEKGYLTDDKDYDSSLQYYYDKVKNETLAKETFEGQVTRFREENIFGADERNYIIIDGKKIDS